MSTPAPNSRERVRNALRAAGLECDIVETPDSARTAVEAAAAVGASVGQIVKSLVFLCDDRPVLALVAGDNRLDEALLAALAGGRITRADAARVREHTGFAIGGVAPLGSLGRCRCSATPTCSRTSTCGRRPAPRTPSSASSRRRSSTPRARRSRSSPLRAAARRLSRRWRSGGRRPLPD